MGGRFGSLCAVPIIQPPFLQPYIGPPCAIAAWQQIAGQLRSIVSEEDADAPGTAGLEQTNGCWVWKHPGRPGIAAVPAQSSSDISQL